MSCKQQFENKKQSNENKKHTQTNEKISKKWNTNFYASKSFPYHTLNYRSIWYFTSKLIIVDYVIADLR